MKIKLIFIFIFVSSFAHSQRIVFVPQDSFFVLGTFIGFSGSAIRDTGYFNVYPRPCLGLFSDTLGVFQDFPKNPKPFSQIYPPRFFPTEGFWITSDSVFHKVSN